MSFKINWAWGKSKCSSSSSKKCADPNQRTIVKKTVTTIDENGVKTVKVYIDGVEQPAEGSTSNAGGSGPSNSRTSGNKATGGATKPAAPAAPAAPPRVIDASKFESESVKEHNKYRAQHGCPPLTLNRELCDLAKDWAENLAGRNAMEHRPDNDFGENIYMAGGMTVEPANAVTAWYDEIKFYKFNQENNDISKTGHFTQLIWKGTTEMGTAIVEKGRSTWVVANYKPHGNVMTKFMENVPRLQI